ncbi:CYTH domain-containing protein [Undibacterium sp. LX40W]|uniref:CYTH domain-containing protein n=1 Tax=Undibacterium nitidum TaxID=2762298 RepID=A0A923KR57_9BURK|nr:MULTISPECIES: CYTH domain-containing protein [Undibacterium]MBC3879871.1 CYTH domain-containing protein [Undibacterium nitidum]MBC3891393.1 CYTH domain-containing protein [Undibacterium sp. LX40W]
MGLEIERKFLVRGDAWKALANPVTMRQGYLSSDPARIVRVRIEDQRAMLTIKGKASGIERAEWEYGIPVADAECMLDSLCTGPLIEKYRYRIAVSEFVWEVDEFLGDNLGLVVAEIELQFADQAFPKPDWVGEEVSHDHRYANSNLLKHPFSAWSKAT